MKKIIICLMVLVMCSILFSEAPIQYGVLRQWHPCHPTKSCIGMDVCVSPLATKSEVLALAKYFVTIYRPDNEFITIFIFDLKEAWGNRDNENYSQKKYFHHFLVSIYVPAINANEITWEKR